MAKNEILLNGSLGQPFQPYREDRKLVTARSWAPWWKVAADDDPDWKNRQPVFSTITLDGRLTQQLSTPWGAHVAGLWQQIPSVAGNVYELTVEGQAWSSEDPEPATRLEASDVNMQAGIDPTGGLDANSPLIVWSDAAQPLCYWETLRVQAEAEASIITVFLRSAPNLPKRQQSIFWRRAFLRPVGRHKRSMNIVGVGDTHIAVDPEYPQPGDEVSVTVSATRDHPFSTLMVQQPHMETAVVAFRGKTQDGERRVWQYRFTTGGDGLYEVRFAGDAGARLLALRLLRVAREVQLVPSSVARTAYKRVYVLLPPTANAAWYAAAARGSFDGRFTIGFSADDAGMGDFETRHVLAVNPHHWPDVLTVSWYQQHYPGVTFTPIMANAPEDLEQWLKNWTGDM